MTITAPPPVGPRGQTFVRLSEQTSSMMVEAIKEGIEDGSIRPDVEPRVLAFSASTLLERALNALGRGSTRAKEDRLGRGKLLSFTFEIFQSAITKG